jgi:hypothetical protein
MARLSRLSDFNNLRQPDSIWEPIEKRTFKFKNESGDDIVITPTELRGELHKFIDNELLSKTHEDIERKREYLKRAIDKQLNEFELSLKRHIDDKINKITETIIERTMERVFEDRVKQEVKQKLKKLLDE